jgi:hypothetical protein
VIWLVFVGTMAIGGVEDGAGKIVDGRLDGTALVGVVVPIVMLAGFAVVVSAIRHFRRLDERDIEGFLNRAVAVPGSTSGKAADQSSASKM